MKTCKTCKQVVNIETVTCPNCEGHEFKLNPVKICSLCGKVNEKKNVECELCGKSFSGKANEYTIATVMNLVLNEDGTEAERKKEDGWDAGEPEAGSFVAKKTPKERYLAIKAEIEEGENEDKCAYFIPGELKERPIVLLPNFEETKKMDVYLVLANKEMPSSIGMEQIAVSKEEDINALNIKKAPKRKTIVAAFFLFWINLAMLCAFGLKIGKVMGFQIVAAIFNKNTAGQSVINAIKESSSFGNYVYFIYPVLCGLTIAAVLLSLFFLKANGGKEKKIILIVIQSVICVLAIGVYLINPLMIKSDWFEIGEGLILLLAFSVLGIISSVLYKYPNVSKQKEKTKKDKPAKKVKIQEDNDFIGLGDDVDMNIS